MSELESTGDVNPSNRQRQSQRSSGPQSSVEPASAGPSNAADTPSTEFSANGDWPQIVARDDEQGKLNSPRKNRLQSPPNYRSTKVRLQLFVLVSAFLLVLVLMNEARKPENWAWLGFGSATSKAQQNDGPMARERELSDEAAPTNDSSNLVNKGAEGDPLGGVGSNEVALPQAAISSAQSYDAWSERAWRQVLQQIRPLEFRRFVGAWMLAQRTSRTPAASPDSLDSLLQVIDERLETLIEAATEQTKSEPQQADASDEWIAKLRADWKQARTYLSAPRVTPDSADPQTENAALARDSNATAVTAPPTASTTDRLTSPPTVTAAGSASAPDGSQLADRWLARMWPIALDLVADRTEMTRLEDGPSWLLVWHRLLNEKPAAAANSEQVTAEAESNDETTHYSLMSQPERFRGMSVRILGELRGIERIDVAANELGLDHYYALWIKPRSAGTIPFCVYAAQLPSELPAPASGWRDVAEPIEVVGRFFKLRSYLTSQNQVEVCPLILTDSVRRPAAGVTMTAEPTANRGSNGWLTLYIVLLPLAAGWIAYRVYQSTKLFPKRSATNRTRETKSLELLQQNADIKSTRQRLAELHAEEKDTAP